MSFIRLLLFLAIVICFPAFGETALSYCVAVEKIDFNPFREIKDGKELAYLVLLRSYISTDPSEPGILAKYEFSPDGRVFTGKINPDLKWSDGEPLTVQQAADGISKALPFRTLGKRVSIVKTELVDESHFKISFESKIQNLTGVFRESLSTNSRHNRFWPIKVSKDHSILVLGKNPQIGPFRFSLGKNQVEVLAKNEKACLKPTFSIFGDMIFNRSEYDSVKSPAPSAITLQLNSGRLSLKERTQLMGWLRYAFQNVDPEKSVESVPSFFLAGEPGYVETVKWPVNGDQKMLLGRTWVVGYENPLFADVIKTALKNSTIKLNLVPLPASTVLDAQILASGIQKGRHVILQDILQWPLVNDFLKATPETRKNLAIIGERSASTIPPDTSTLREFEVQALKEVSLVPLARRYPIAFSKKGSHAKLLWSALGELNFHAE